GELLDGDSFRNGDLADELFFGLVGGVPLQPLDAAAEGGDRSLALLVGAERGHDREPSAVLLRAAARRFRRRRRSRRARTAGRVPGACASSGSSAGRAPGLAVAMLSSPKRFFASCSALSLVSRSCLRRFSSSALRASAASRSVRSLASRRLRTNASSSAILRSSASRSRASLSACTRAFCSSSVRLRSTIPPDGLGAAAGVAGAGASAAAGAAGLPVAARLAGATDVAASAFARVGTRLFTFSTTTALVRPWLKLWRTTPCSTPRPLRVRVLLGLTLSFFSPVFSVVSAIPIPILGSLAVFHHVPASPAAMADLRT